MMLHALRPLLLELLVLLNTYRIEYRKIRDDDPTADDLGHGALCDLIDRMALHVKTILHRSKGSGAGGGLRAQPHSHRFEEASSEPRAEQSESFPRITRRFQR